MEFLKKHIFLVLSAVFLGLSALNFFIFEKDAPGASEEHYISSIRSRVIGEVLRSKTELFEIGTQYQKSPGNAFLNFETPSAYPYYIFRNGQLFYWSDHRYVPNYQELSKIKESKLLSVKNLGLNTLDS